MNIAFFVSNHGYGHLMRELPIIGELLDCGNCVVLVTAEKHIALSKTYLNNHTKGELITIADEVDVGLCVYPGTLTADWGQTEERLRDYIDSWPEKIEFGKQLLQKYNVATVVVDIVPWALKAAKAAGVKTILCSNFTWVDQYEGNISEDVIRNFNECYSLVDKALLLELATPQMKKRFPDGMDVGFCCRPFNSEAVEEIRKIYDKPIVYVSVGGSNSGLDFDIDVRALPYQFISTAGLKFVGDNVTYLPTETDNTNDYIAAADYCITKAGWGTIGEEMIAGNKVALIERPDVFEDTRNIKCLAERGRAMPIRIDDLRDIGSVLKAMQGLKAQVPCTNNYKMIADELIDSVTII